MLANYSTMYFSELLSTQSTVICSVEIVNLPLVVNVVPYKTACVLAGFSLRIRIYRQDLVYYVSKMAAPSSVRKNSTSHEDAGAGDSCCGRQFLLCFKNSDVVRWQYGTCLRSSTRLTFVVPRDLSLLILLVIPH
jgi:hypothetical protein